MFQKMFLAIGGVAYLIFLATFLYLVAFVGDLPWVPYTIDRGGTVGPALIAIPVDLALIAAFGLQHSIMARPAFKRMWTKIIPAPLERSLYVLAASMMLIAMFLLWRPVLETVWVITDDIVAVGLWGLFVLGWLIVLSSTFLINHFELFGLRQVWSHARGAAMPDPVFRTPFLYRFVRHPLYSGFIMAFVAIPHMTLGHALLAAAMSCYILIAIRHEERDLVAMFGDRYVDYRGDVGMLAPRLRKTER